MSLILDATFAIGNTPIIKINRLAKDLKATILVKVEGGNPFGSIKDRVALSMIRHAEIAGILDPQQPQKVTIIEPTSGNTGIGLAGICAIKGYPITLIMPDSMSVERQKVLKGLGANILLTPGAQGMSGSIKKAEELIGNEPGKYYMPSQFENPANPQIHYETTGPEIWDDTEGKVDIIVAGVGTGGTITGIAKFLKEKKNVKAIAVEPKESQVLSATKAGNTPKAAPHKIQGIGANFKPACLDLNIIDEILPIAGDKAIEMAKQLQKIEGISSGISGGAALATALEIAKRPQNFGKVIVAIIPDRADRYLSTELYL